MRCVLLVLTLLVGKAMAADPLAEGAARFRTLDTYRVTVRAFASDGERQVIRYAWRRPGWIRMDFVEPHGGTVMIYDPVRRRVRLSPFGVEHMPTLNLSPDNPLIRSPRGHSVDRSDVGALFANMLQLRARGSAASFGDAEVGGRAAEGIEVAGEAGASVAGVHRYRVWLARDSLFPLKVQSYDATGALIETVEMSDVEIDAALPARVFTP